MTDYIEPRTLVGPMPDFEWHSESHEPNRTTVKDASSGTSSVFIYVSFHLNPHTVQWIKGIVWSKMELLSSYSHSCVVPNLYDFVFPLSARVKFENTLANVFHIMKIKQDRYCQAANWQQKAPQHYPYDSCSLFKVFQSHILVPSDDVFDVSDVQIFQK